MSDYLKEEGGHRLVIMEETKQLLTPLTRSQDVMRKVIDMMGKARMNKRSKIILRKTLKNMTHVVQEIKQYNEHLDQPREEIVTLVKEKDAGEELMCSSCSRSIWWTIFLSWLPLYGDGLWHNRSDSFDADKQVKDIKIILYEVRVVVELLEMENFEQKLKGVGASIKCPFGVPENPEFTVGLDLLLSKLKIEVLGDGMSTLLLTGLGGSGKTTLATKLCRDEEIKGKFKENILFFTFSQTPKLKNVIGRLFEHCGYHVPEFITDEDAIKRLGILLRKVEGSPLLLVLDDVWPGSEALIEKFKFQMSDYKILVTSRVTFPKIGTPFVLKQLAHEDAMTLFQHHALLKKSSSSVPDEELVQKAARYCKGLPLAIKVIGKSLSHQPIELWQKMVEELSQGHSILDSNIELLTCFQKLLHVLEDNPNMKECFMDLGLFPEDQRIPVPVLTDIWAVLYKFDDDGIEAMDIINKLESMNLVNVIVARKNSSDTDNYYYNNRFVILHDLLRELAIYQNNQEPIEKRKRLISDINENKGEWWIGEKQQGMISRVLTKFRSCSVKQTLQPVPARTLSISADETNTSYQSHIQPSQAEVLVLNLQTKKYSFPELVEKMSELKVLIMTNYGFHPCELENFKLLNSVSNLRRIRLERISVPQLGELKNLEKLSLYMCSNTSRAFENGTIPVSDLFPKLSDLNIDYCKDLVELPTGICDIAPLKKLSITNCHKLGSLTQGFGKLLNLELLNLSSCTDLEELPDSIVNLSKLSLLDLSNCISLSSLPEDIGNLCNLRNLNMTSCARCELPYSITNLENLKVVVCDEETAASWETFEDMLPNMKLEVPRVEVNLNWLHSISS